MDATETFALFLFLAFLISMHYQSLMKVDQPLLNTTKQSQIYNFVPCYIRRSIDLIVSCNSIIIQLPKMVTDQPFHNVRDIR